jgi:hypothetical protein
MNKGNIGEIFFCILKISEGRSRNRIRRRIREGDRQVINILLTLVTYKVAWDLHDKVNTWEDGLHMVSKSIKTSFSRN